MATASATQFEPTIDTFGQLTVRANRASRLNLLIVLAFLAGFILLLTVIGLIDSQVFESAHHSTLYYGGVPLDYD